jgi:hypothetical protein
MTGFLLATVQTDGSGLHQQAAGAVSTGIVYLIGFVMPRLDLFGQTWWLNHGLPTDTPLVLIVLQAIVYTALLIAATVFDFQKRQF